MANSNLTPDMITREALRILHQKLNFCGNIVREYDSSFASEGGKIGNTLRIRMPLQYATGTGATIATGTGADSIGTQTTLTVNTQRHVPMRFTSEELTMDIEDFSMRHIEPAMSILAAKIEYDGLSTAYKYVGNHVDAGTAVDFAEVMTARARLVETLAPMNDRVAIMDPQGMVDLVNANKSLFQDSKEVSRQYKEGMMGRFGGFDFYENSLMPSHTTGAAGGTNTYDIAGANQNVTPSSSVTDLTSQTLDIDVGTAVIAAGDIITIAGVNAVHPESKADLGYLKEFSVVAGGTGTTTITVAPAIVSAGPYKNVSAAPADNAVVTVNGAASTAYKQSLLFQKGFMCMGTADLVLPKGTDMASRQQYDGISMRLVRDYAVVKDTMYTRLDVLYGFKVLRPDLAVRILHT